MRLFVAACFMTAASGCSPSGRAEHPSRHQANAVALRPDAYRGACAVAAACIPASRLEVSECATRRTRARTASSVDMVYRGTELSDVEVRCLVHAGGDCETAARCVGSSPDAESCDPSDGGSCDGSAAHGCHLGLRVRTSESCASGTICHPCTARGACCGVPCSHPERCDGDVLLRCENGFVANRLNCRDYGMSCADHPTAVSDCLGDGPSCNRNLASHCDGQDLVSCFAGKELRVSCEELSMACATWKTGATTGGRCVMTQAQCSLGRESCTGATLHICDDGVPADVDCRQLGFAACSKRADGRAVCTH